MRRLHTGVVSALALVLGVSATQADAQSLRGFRAEGQAGITSFHSEGNQQVEDRLGRGSWRRRLCREQLRSRCRGHLLGLRPRTTPSMALASPITRCSRSGALRLRAGVDGDSVDPRLRQGRLCPQRAAQGVCAVQAAGGGTNVGGARTPVIITTTVMSAAIQWGGGIEQNITNNVLREGRRPLLATTSNHTHALTGLIGLGVLFGATRSEAAPPPPPSAAASSAASGDADVPGRQRDPGDRHLPGSAASAAASAASGAAWRTRLSSGSRSRLGRAFGSAPFFCRA